MPYIIAAVVLIVAGLAFTLYQTSTLEQTEIAEVREAEPLPMDSTQSAQADGAMETSAETNSIAPSTPPDQNDPAVSQMNDAVQAADSSTGAYKDGTYSTVASYFTPRRTEHVMDITITLEDGIITSADVLYDGAEPKTPNHSSFDNALGAVVIGQPIEEVYLSRVGGASLTSDSFNEALTNVKAEASS